VLLGVDVGGTFTDAVIFDGRTLHTAKAPTTADDPSRGVLEAVDRALDRAGAEPGALDSFAHGMTVGTNALLTERGARTALIATAGFADLLDVARQNRPSLYRLCAPKPEPLVVERLRFEAAERTGPDGVAEELTEDELERLIAAVREAEPDSVAVCLPFA
jgi:N-methylhydantoinase A/oxoprolinase/acetone carboxylase beta subunit